MGSNYFSNFEYHKLLFFYKMLHVLEECYWDPFTIVQHLKSVNTEKKNDNIDIFILNFVRKNATNKIICKIFFFLYYC